MTIRPAPALRWTLMLTALVCLTASARATDLQVTITSHVPAGGFAFSPVWLGIHNGTFDTFDSGSAASGSVEAIAELGDSAPVTAAFTGQGPQTTLANGGPFTPGVSASTTISVADPMTTRYLSYMAMVVPSNDLFFGNGDPQGVELFDAGGNFVGPTTINIFGGNVWDAGTEVNDVTNGIAFIQGQTATDGAVENGTVGLFFDRPDAASFLASILGKTSAPGYEISELISSQGLIATINIQQVPEPGSFALAVLGLGALALAAHRRRLRRSNRA